jgi:toxin YoeB
MIKVFSDEAWGNYLYWQREDKRILNKINSLIQDIERNGNEGIGKPEPLTHELSGFWSRRITNEHRLVYQIDDGKIFVATCRYHYFKD